MRQLEIYDLECLANCFTYTGYVPDEDKYYQFVIWKDKNDLEALYNHVMRGIYLVGYNNLEYDCPLLEHIIRHYKSYLLFSSQELTYRLYQKSQEIIDMEFSAIAERNMTIPQLDLMKIHHYNNKAKLTGLKLLEISMRMENVEEMPFHHSNWINNWEQIERILAYNKNDVIATYRFYLITIGQTDLPLYKGKNKLQLRKDIKQRFGLNCFNYNDVKIGDELNKLNYLKNNPGIQLQKGGTKYESICLGDCIFDNVKFESNQLNEFLERLKLIVLNEENQEFNEEIIYKGVTYTFGLGGIHTKDLPRKIIPKENEKLEDRDCASMYPASILNYKLFPKHLGVSWLEGYHWTFDQRIINKKMSKDLSLSLEERKSCESIQEAFKLSLNGGGFGKTGESSSWQHDLKVMLTVTLSNQLFLLMLAEKYTNNNITVLSCNTDGIVILFNKVLQPLIDSIDKEWQEVTGHILEYTEYTKFIQTSVNDYITLKPNGDCKFKGDFEIDRELHKDPSMRIVPIALKEYFINNIPVEQTIKNHKDIYDFCLMVRCNKRFDLVAKYIESTNSLVEKNASKTQRYYASHKGCYLFKKNVDSESEREGKYTGVNVGQIVTLFNKYVEKPFDEYKIDYTFYIKECKKIINKIELEAIQASLF